MEMFLVCTVLCAYVQIQRVDMFVTYILTPENE